MSFLHWLLLIVILLSGAIFLIVTLNIHTHRKRGRYHPLVEDLVRRPGESLEVRIAEQLEKLAMRYAGMCVMIVFAAVSFGTLDGTNRNITVAALLFAVAVTARMVYGSLDRIRQVKLGQLCERYTGQELDLLMRKGAFVFHDIPIANGASGCGNIDHIVIGKQRIFAVETKGVSKPAAEGSQRSKLAKVRFDGTSLHFPRHVDRQSVQQAIRNAEILASNLSTLVGARVDVTPVVALPGWFVTVDEDVSSPVLVINPKRGKYLSRLVESDAQRSPHMRSVIHEIERVARSVRATSSVHDPDGAMTHDIWLNRRPVEVALR